MDGNYRIEMVLDRMRDTQHHHGALLEQLTQGQAKNNFLLLELLHAKSVTGFTPPLPLASPPPKSRGPWLSVAKVGVSAGAQYAAGILSIHYLLSGGDVLQLLQVVLKAFAGGP